MPLYDLINTWKIHSDGHLFELHVSGCAHVKHGQFCHSVNAESPATALHVVMLADKKDGLIEGRESYKIAPCCNTRTAKSRLTGPRKVKES